jgi:hypothetical protein
MSNKLSPLSVWQSRNAYIEGPKEDAPIAVQEVEGTPLFFSRLRTLHPLRPCKPTPSSTNKVETVDADFSAVAFTASGANVANAPRRYKEAVEVHSLATRFRPVT